jgi:FMN phosphatase YigB (HAD superfamily)
MGSTTFIDDRSRIRVIVFDIGNVLIPFDWNECVSTIEKMEKGASYRLLQVVGSELMISYEKGLIPSEEFYHQIIQILGIHINFSDFKELFSSIFVSNDKLVNLLPSLREWYKIYALSNTCEIHINRLNKEYSLLKYFDEYILSYMIGHVKPEEEMFLEVLKRSNLQPGEHLYIDDNLNFTEFAKSLGFQTHHFVSNEALLDDFRKRGIV